METPHGLRVATEVSLSTHFSFSYKKQMESCASFICSEVEPTLPMPFKERNAQTLDIFVPASWTPHFYFQRKD